MDYDDASWHYSEKFPKGLPPSAAATHIGMFLAWALLSDLGSELHTFDLSEDLTMLQTRTITPGEYLLRVCDEKFGEEDLGEIGNEFALDYFEDEDGPYMSDYERVLGGGKATLYHVADSWENFDLLEPVLNERFARWAETGSFEGM